MSSNIIGIGTDIVDVRRIQAAFMRNGARFSARIYTPAEIAYCESAAHPERTLLRYANRFAAKEASYKALGVHRGAGISWQEIEVIRKTMDAPPSLVFHGKALQHLSDHLIPEGGTLQTHLSLSDEYPYALAFIILTAIL
jgi:holo-[acyl-carrier protein] synthase